MKVIKMWLLVAGYVSGCVALLAVSGAAAGGQGEKDKIKYMGVDKCKSCHKSEKKGDQYGQWEKTRHAKAYEVLASAEAKKLAKEKGLGDPQKEAACLKCHVTAHGVDKKLLYKKFDAGDGIQCEACHGPGEKHAKNRLLSEDDDKTQHEDAKKEMVLPEKDMCSKCHNEESPSIEQSKFWDKEKKQFDVEKAWKEILHPNPMWKDEKK